MHAYELTILEKTKALDFAIVSAEDFTTQPGPAIDPKLLLTQPNLSLYCLDHANGRALFVETPATLDLLQAPCLTRSLLNWKNAFTASISHFRPKRDCNTGARRKCD